MKTSKAKRWTNDGKEGLKLVGFIEEGLQAQTRIQAQRGWSLGRSSRDARRISSSGLLTMAQNVLSVRNYERTICGVLCFSDFSVRLIVHR